MIQSEEHKPSQILNGTVLIHIPGDTPKIQTQIQTLKQTLISIPALLTTVLKPDLSTQE